MKRRCQFRWMSLLLLLALLTPGLPRVWGQAVLVTAQLDDPLLVVGQSTTLRVLAQVEPGLRPQAERIFSWYVDVLNTNGAVAVANYSLMLKTASDQDPILSSTGVDDGPNRRGIYDTFLHRPGAGVSNAVELMAIPVAAVAPGQTRFRVAAGTGVPLEYDFSVAPVGGGDPWTGGDYTAAAADLTVVPVCTLAVSIQRVNGGGPGQSLELSFAPCPGYDHYVEYTDTLGAVWQPLPGGPHNSGTVTVPNDMPHRFYRVRVQLP